VDLAEPAGQRWRSLGRDLGDNLHELLEEVVELCEEHLTGVPSVLRPLAKAALHGASRLGGSLIGTIASWYGGEYTAEIKGLAAAAEVPFSQVLLSNLMYDLSQYAERWGGASACSSFSCNVRGTPVLARNMDWCWPNSLGRHTVLIRFHRGRKSYLSVGIVGMVGVLSALSGEWSVVLNQAPAGKLPFNYLQFPALQRLRAACDRMGSFSGLVRRLCEFQTMTPCFFHAVGTRPKEHVVITGMGQEFSRRHIHGRVLIQTNHFIDHEHLNPDDEEVDAEGVTWVYDTRPRYEALVRRLRRPPTTLAEAMTKLSRPPVTTTATQQQMAFHPATGAYIVRLRA